MDYTNWDQSIYSKLVNHNAPNKLSFIKSGTGSEFISKGLLASPKVYCVQTHNEDIMT